MVDVKNQWDTVENNLFLLTNYPGLSFISTKQIEGELAVNATYDPIKNIVKINPQTYEDQSYYIEDTYSIKIELPENPQEKFPIVYETGGKITAAGEKHGVKNHLDLHIFKNGSVCLSPLPQLVERIITGKSKSLPLLLDELITPYFYQQSYYARTGSWIFQNYSHGFQAIFEYYYREVGRNNKDIPLLLDLCISSLKSLAKIESCKYLLSLIEEKREIKPTSKCFCGSRRKYKKCHRRTFTKEAKAGFINFMEDLRIKNQ